MKRTDDLTEVKASAMMDGTWYRNTLTGNAWQLLKDHGGWCLRKLGGEPTPTISPTSMRIVLRDHYKQMEENEFSINDRPPNFRDDDGQLYLVRCFKCDAKRGLENYAPAVATGNCAWCGWNEQMEEPT